MHCNLGRAKLRLKGRYTLATMAAAVKDIQAEKKIVRCHQHRMCVRLVGG